MRLLAAFACVIVAMATAGRVTTADQGLVGVQANWRDLETWSHLVEGSRENELGLGLQPEGGAVVAFLGRLSIANPRTPPSALRVQLAAAYNSNPNVMRVRSLTFLAGFEGSKEGPLKLDLSAKVLTDDVSPGGIINNGMGTIRAADFVRLSEAKTLTGNVLGFDVVFRPDQIRAMHALAERLYLVSTPRN